MSTRISRGSVPPSRSSIDSVPVEDKVFHDAHFFKDMALHYNDPALSDVTLVIGTRTFHSHKFVLAKSSDVLRTMLYKRKWEECGKPEVRLEESEECARVFDRFLQFLYTSEISLNINNVTGVLFLADKYNISSLFKLCTKFMAETCADLNNLRQIVHWYPIAKSLDAEELKEACSSAIRLNFGTLLAKKKLNVFDIGSLVDFLSSSDVIVKDEFSVWQGVSEWLMEGERKEELACNAVLILPRIRFSQMLLHQLNEVEKNPLASDEACSDLINRLLLRAYKFRAILPSQSKLRLQFDDDFYQARLYESRYCAGRELTVLAGGRRLDQITLTTPITALPTEEREAHWMIALARSEKEWMLKLYCQESSMVDNGLRVQLIIVYYTSKSVPGRKSVSLPIGFHREPPCKCSNTALQIKVVPPKDVKKVVFIVEVLPQVTSEVAPAAAGGSSEAGQDERGGGSAQ